jgi:hypothetical protein
MNKFEREFPFAIQVEPLVEQIRPILAGKEPPLQGAVLADLTALWLAGFVIKGDPKGTHALREELLLRHFELVCQLIKVNARMLGTYEEES